MQPLFSQNDNLNISVGTAFNSKNALGFYNNLRTNNKSNINFNQSSIWVNVVTPKVLPLIAYILISLMLIVNFYLFSFS